MPTQRFNRLTPEAQRRILEGARAEFARDGHDGASINGIIQAAGINKGSLYYYFEDKADLFMAVVHDASAELVAAVAGGGLGDLFEVPAGDFWGYLNRASTQKVVFAIHHTDLMRIFSDAFRLAQLPGAPPRFQAYKEETREMMRRLLRVGQEQGSVRTDLPLDLLADLITVVSEVWNHPMLQDPSIVVGWGPEQIQSYVAPQLDMVRRMIGVEKGEFVQ